LDVIIKLLPAESKKNALEELCRLAAPIAQIDKVLICRAIFERERLGSTGIGSGVAVPHARLAKLTRPVCVFARLSKPVDFDAIDGERVDLIFLLLSPESSNEAHLRTLAKASRILRDPSTLRLLRSAPGDNLIESIFYKA
jgi:PTS system nitrogen regulatory IIA component